MLSLRTTLLLIGAAALALAGEIQPSQNRPNDPSWYCQWKRRVVYDRYSLEGRGWGISEGELKKAISKSNGAITGWKYDEDDEGGFKAAVSFMFIFNSIFIFVVIVFSCSYYFCFSWLCFCFFLGNGEHSVRWGELINLYFSFWSFRLSVFHSAASGNEKRGRC